MLGSRGVEVHEGGEGGRGPFHKDNRGLQGATI